MNNQVKIQTTHENNAQMGGIYILRIATILLALVSWWATAQGMANYVFPTGWQAYLASLAIQSILLGLNFYLPTFWHYTTSNTNRWGLAILSLIVLLCSSWFSYVFIVGRSYKESWDTISRLLVQSSYRKGLYGAQDYIEEYDMELRDILGNQVSTLYSQAKDIEHDNPPAIESIDLSQDQIDYADNQEFAANGMIAPAIQFMTNALPEDASANDRTQAVEQISKLANRIDNQINTLKNDIERTNDAITQAGDNLLQAQNRLDNAPNGTDTTTLENAVNSASLNYANQQSRAVELQADLEDYQTAQLLLDQYLSYLDGLTSEAGAQISSALRTIQSELLSNDIDVENIAEDARKIFNYLQASADTLSTEDTIYQTMLNELDSFIRNIQKYATVRKSEQTFDELVGGLEEESYITDSNWKTTWLENLERLKSEIGSLPSYTGSSNVELYSYIRTDEIDNLDNILHKYISNHNAADQALIYLSSPYKKLAIFSLFLALFLDMAAFITGFIIDIVDQRQARKMLRSNPQANISDTNQNSIIAAKDFVSVPSTARRYVFLTGDFTKEDNQYRYQALEGDEQIEVEGQDLQAGFHVEIDGRLCSIIPQELAFFRTQNGPRDGIYQDCYLQYSDNMLSIKHDPEQEYRYLATMDDDIPVYQIRNNECIIQNVQDIPPQIWKTAIVALNSKGTQVAAIYLT